MIRIDWTKFMYERGIRGYCLYIYKGKWESGQTDWNIVAITPTRSTMFQIQKERNKLLPTMYYNTND